MRPLRHEIALVVGVLVGNRPAVLQGQWGLALEAQRAAFGGTSRDTSAGGRNQSFRPAGALGVTVRIDHDIGRIAVSLGVRYLRSAILLDTPDLFIGLQDDFVAIEAAPEIRVRIVRTAAGVSVHLYGGPVIGVWMFSDLGARGVPGGIAGLAAEFPVVERLAFWVRAGAGFTHSVFRDGELPVEFERRATRRAELSLGLRYGR